MGVELVDAAVFDDAGHSWSLQEFDVGDDRVADIGSLMDVTDALPRSRPLTYADLRHMPDDGHRYELVDGTLLVTPAPRTRHQLAVVALLRALADAAPDDLVALVAPFDYVVSDVTVLEPDLLVARRAELGEDNLRHTPVLVVEVLSPSTRHVDLGTKRLAFEAAGVPSYWVVDPDAPDLLVLELEGGSYREVIRVTHDEPFEAAKPFPVRIVPATW